VFLGFLFFWILGLLHSFDILVLLDFWISMFLAFLVFGIAGFLDSCFFGFLVFWIFGFSGLLVCCNFVFQDSGFSALLVSVDFRFSVFLLFRISVFLALLLSRIPLSCKSDFLEMSTQAPHPAPTPQIY